MIAHLSFLRPLAGPVLVSLAVALGACGAAPDDEPVGSGSAALTCKPGQTRYCEPGARGVLRCVCEDDQPTPDAGVTPDSGGASCTAPAQLCQCSQCPSYCTTNLAYCLDITSGYCASGTQCIQR